MKKSLNIIIILLLTFTATIAIAACGGGSGSEYSNESLQLMDSAPAPGEGFNANERLASEDSIIPADRKIIRNASLDIMAPDAPGLYHNIVTYGTGIGGYEHSYSLSDYETYSVIHAVFKVPPEKLSVFVNYIGENGNVVNSSMNSEDITENYFDASTRLDTKRRSLEQYYQLLMQATGVEEIVYIQRIIDEITEDIEALEGRLNVWNSQVNMATVNLYIRQDNDPIQIRKEINWNTLSADDMGYLIKRGFISVTNTIMSVLQWLIVIIVGYSPLWIILGAGVFLWRVIRKKINTKKTPVSVIENKGTPEVEDKDV